MSHEYTLVIGSKEFSSWSLRPWILMREAGIPFDEVLIALRQPGTKAEIASHSRSGQVPVLKRGKQVIWDSLAIAEFLHDQHPEKHLWPADAEARAFGRSIAAEMHSGFRALRNNLSMVYSQRNLAADLTPEVEDNIRRIVALWREARSRFGAHGPFLLGAFSIADAMYAPVASRFTSYAVDLKHYGDDGKADTWCKMMMSRPHMLDWGAAA
jgi:glutathione S-transferase